jgi:hypothetical protein
MSDSPQEKLNASSAGKLDPESYWDPGDPADRERVLDTAIFLVKLVNKPVVIWAASRGLTDFVRYLIIVEPDHVWRHGAEALWEAHEHGHTESVRLLEDFFGIN